MRIISLTDLHGRQPDINSILKQTGHVDLILVTGDTTHFGGASEADAIIRSINDHGIPVLAVAGNCDLPGVDQVLDKMGIQLHGTYQTVGPVAVLGVGGSLPCPGNTPNEMGEHAFESLLNQAVSGLDDHLSVVMVSHQPPFGTVNDSLTNGSHVGSHAVRTFIEKTQPLVCFTGHIHEGMGIDRIGQTYIVNPGPAYQGGYGYAEINDGKVLAEIRKC